MTIICDPSFDPPIRYTLTRMDLAIARIDLELFSIEHPSIRSPLDLNECLLLLLMLRSQTSHIIPKIDNVDVYGTLIDTITLRNAFCRRHSVE